MSKIHDPNNPCHLPPIPPGYVIEPDDPLFIKANKYHAEKKLRFTVLHEISGPPGSDEDFFLMSRKLIG